MPSASIQAIGALSDAVEQAAQEKDCILPAIVTAATGMTCRDSDRELPSR